jgi:hypothetical protein
VPPAGAVYSIPARGVPAAGSFRWNRNLTASVELSACRPARFRMRFDQLACGGTDKKNSTALASGPAGSQVYVAQVVICL